MTWVEALLGSLAAATLLPVAVMAVEVLAAMPARRERPMPAEKRPRIVVLVPAHNEALLIADTVRSIATHLGTGDRLLVVADNCTDATARTAATAGAEVIERQDHERRGKIHALDFGVRHLAGDPPGTVVIVDADCRLQSGALERLVRLSAQTQRPVQGLYLMHAPANAGLSTRIAEFAWLLKNQVRAIGGLRLGLPCQLMGTGMAFPWRCIGSVALGGSYISEDYKLGLDLARAGAPALFCPEARVTSYFPSTPEGLATQRTRWEHGHIALITGVVPALLLEAVTSCNIPLLGLVIDLSVPPLSLLALATLAAFACGAVFYAVAAAPLPLWLATASLSILVISVLLSWVRYARHVIPLHRLIFAPVYAILKIPLYMKFLWDRQTEWVRSRRDGE